MPQGLRNFLAGFLPEEVVELVERFVGAFRLKDIRTYAGSTTYFMLLSVIPALLVVSSVLLHTSLVREEDVVGLFLMIFPDASADLVRRVCGEAYRTSTALLPVSVVLLLWSAGLGMMQLTRGLNVLNDVTERRNYFRLRLTATLYTILVLMLMLAVLLLQVFVRQLVGLWQSFLPYVEVPEVLTFAGRYVVLFVAAVLLFLLLYSTLPAKPMRASRQLPGALMAAVGWEVFSAFFSLYVRYSQNLSVYYGSLTTMVVLLLWVYWCVYIVLVGAFVNRFLEINVYPLADGPVGPPAPGPAGPTSASRTSRP